MNQKLSIALLGGTFDPIHNGHVQIAEAVIEQLPINQVWFVPAADPPHKNKTMFSFAQRIEFIKEVISGWNSNTRDRVFVYEKDFRKSDKSYTIYLIEDLQTHYPNYNFSFIIGADNVIKLKTWLKYDELIDKIDLLVINREIDDKSDWVNLEYYNKLKFINMPQMDISSSEIRNMIENKEDISRFVPFRSVDVLIDTP